LPAEYAGDTLSSERMNAMKVAGMVGVPALAALAVAAAANLCAQNAGSVQGTIGVGVGIGGAFSVPGLTGAPYSATRTTTRVQTLADGTTVTHTTTVKEARDSEGRTYHATQMEMVPAGRPPMTIYFVSDSAKRITMNWSSNGKVVTVNHWPEPQTAPQPARHLPSPQDNQITAPVRTPIPRNTNPDLHIDDLGTQTINGVPAQGRRITRVIPAGREGNDQPITVTTETWISPEIRTDVLQVTDDPRSGNSRMELSDIDLNEPDPSLFQAPEGYTMQEMEPVQPHVADTNPQ
jgi:hypothetical protein